MSSDKFNPFGMPGMPPMMPGMDPSMGGMMPGMPIPQGMPGDNPRAPIDLGAERIILPGGMRAPSSKKILICGLPESGKTTLAEELADELIRFGRKVAWFNGGDMRKNFNDTDFTERGRVRQAWRMRAAVDDALQSGAEIGIADFIAPTEEVRNAFSADIVIWMNTPNLPRRYEDTAQMWEDPIKVDFTVTTQDCKYWVPLIVQKFKLAHEEQVSSLLL